MSRKMLIDAANEEEVRVCVLENKRVEEFDFESAARKALRGNIYLARVTRVEPSLQAAFVEYGGNRHGFLAFSEIHPDYYQIPVSDREAIRAAEAEEAELADLLNLHPSEEDDRGDGNGDVDAPLDAAGEADAEASADAAADDEDRETRKAKSSKPRRGRRRRKDRKADAADADSAADSDEPRADAENDAATDADGGAGEDGLETAKRAGDEKGAQATAEEPSVTDGMAEKEEEEEEEEEDEASEAHDPKPHDANAEDDTEEAPGERVQAEEQDEAGDEFATGDDDDAPQEEADDLTASADLVEDDDDPEDSDADDDGLDAATRSDLMKRYEDARRKRMRLLRNYKIQEVIKRRQILLVQVVKEERGNKGAALTTYLSLAGRYCVLMPNTARGGGISRKIPNASDRKRLRKVVDGLEVPKGMGLIIRTAGAKRTKAEIKRDYDYLARLWENIRSQTLESIAPALIYEEASLIKRAIRDLYDKDIDQVLVHGEEGYREAKDFMKMLMPSHAKNVQPYKEDTPLFLKYGVEKQLDAMYEPVVRLKSGGYIVINQTEALIAIDVNSGKATRERNIEQTALKTNLEAAKELSRQCRLRDLAGLIVVDFIDMDEHRNNRSVEKKFKDALKTDRARIQVGRISNFGLLEMSRQRRRSGIVDGTTNACPTCHGAGVVRSREMAGLRILRAIEAEAIEGRAEVLTVKASADVVLYVLNEKRDWLIRIENAYGVKTELQADAEKHGDHYDIERRGARKAQQVEAAVRADLSEMAEVDADTSTERDEASRDQADASASDDDESGDRKRRRRRRRRKGGDAESATASEASSGEDDAAVDADADPENEDDKPKKRRRRGRRGGRRAARKDGDDITADDDTTANEGSSDEASVDASAEETAGGDNDGRTPQDDSEAVRPAAMTRPPATMNASDGDVDEPENVEMSGDDGFRDPSDGDIEDAAVDEIEDLEPLEASLGADADEAPAKKRKASRKGWWQRAIGG